MISIREEHALFLKPVSVNDHYYNTEDGFDSVTGIGSLDFTAFADFMHDHDDGAMSI